MAKSGAEDHSPHNKGGLGRPHKPLDQDRPTHWEDDDDGLGGGWIFLIVILVVLVLGLVGFIVFRRWRAAKAGLPPPPLNPFKRAGSPTAAAFAAGPRPGGIKGWFTSTLNSLRGYQAKRERGRYATGAGYEGSRGIDADEAWDTRVGAEETGYHGAKAAPSSGGYAQGYAQPGDFDHEMDARGASYADLTGEHSYRGRGRDSLDSENERDNPFGNGAERSSWVRGVSPRPIDNDTASVRTKDSTERRSMFREDV